MSFRMLNKLLLVTAMMFFSPLSLAHQGEKHAEESSTAAKETKPSAVKDTGVVADDDKARAYFTDLELVTQKGEKVKFYTDVLKDHIVVINFIYTNCEGACPLATQKLTAVRTMLGDKIGGPLRFVSISLDPERDSPAALTDFAKKYKADAEDWVFLTGNVDNVNQIIKRLGQFTESLESHSTLMLAGDVRTAHWMKIPPQALPISISEKIRLLLEQRS